jgi:hypothetical protein
MATSGLVTAFAVWADSVATGLDELGGGSGGANAAAVGLTSGISAIARAAASPDPRAMALISCGFFASVPRMLTRMPEVSGADSRCFAALISA